MANPVLSDLVAQVDRAQGVMASARLFIQGEAARIEAAIAQALLNGATEAELEPFRAEVEELRLRTDELSEAMASNPLPPGPTPTP